MKRYILLIFIALLGGRVAADHRRLPTAVADTVRTGVLPREASTGRPARSAYPVSLTVRGNSLCVSSKRRQLLPIYTQGGSLYLTMQLATGDNWLFGLPRGSYRINNHIVNIL